MEASERETDALKKSENPTEQAQALDRGIDFASVAVQAGQSHADSFENYESLRNDDQAHNPTHHPQSLDALLKSARGIMRKEKRVGRT